MKNYDDLQRFKEKTQTLDIAFKDMSGQSQEADQSQWALLRQLTTEQEPELGSGQRIDMPQPQPIRGDEFSAPPEPAQAAPASPTRASILDSLNAPAAAQPESGSSLFPPAPSVKPLSSATPLAPKATLVERQATTSLFPPAKPAAAPAAQPAAVAAPAAPAPIAPVPVPTLAAAVEPARPAAPAPSRFGALFRSRPAEPANLSKETPLKPLLEKIALCR
ncbi:MULTISPECIES: cellulose biosynthesis protein BcsO [Pantoea]|uniref:Cellulose biosynthesis protein BcsO n=2 Tax=Pantoea TaxID=53335 RepID=A0AAU7TVD2_9GAMM|nr:MULTISPECIES: cellulose biosynthesis protein BcsO [Pantoea]MBD9661850.1 cellulose biosynthesis protein BcsO [Pantoea sp. PNT03]PLR20770.1 cellulose biosynthesis protein BcsO [Pantoea endophytica]PYG47297.1 cellulose biosynthesis protein BcsO [Pantoea sp. AG1095]